MTRKGRPKIDIFTLLKSNLTASFSTHVDTLLHSCDLAIRNGFAYEGDESHRLRHPAQTESANLGSSPVFSEIFIGSGRRVQTESANLDPPKPRCFRSFQPALAPSTAHFFLRALACLQTATMETSCPSSWRCSQVARRTCTMPSHQPPNEQMVMPMGMAAVALLVTAVAKSTYF